MVSLTYDEFRCGVTFKQVRAELKEEQRLKYLRGEYMFISRRTVLGRMHQHKLALWEQYVEYRDSRSDSD